MNLFPQANRDETCLQDAILANQDAGSMRAVFAPKVDGAARIIPGFARQPVNQLSFFSSVAGVLGSSGQANYAAANASLDALSTSLQSQVGPVFLYLLPPHLGSTCIPLNMQLNATASSSAAAMNCHS